MDAGEAFDAGRREDAGTDDAGSPDAGGDEDAGIVDAGSDAGCVIDAGALPFACDGSEDFCDPLGDAQGAQSDLLAGWSHTENSQFVLELLFAAPPFTSTRFETLGILLDEDDDSTNNDCSFAVQVDGALVALESGDRIFDLHPDFTHLYPPRGWVTQAATTETPVSLDVCADLDVTTDGRAVRFRLGSQYSDGRPYALNVTLSAPSTTSSEFPTLDRVISRGNTNVAADYVPACSLTCPAN